LGSFKIWEAGRGLVFSHFGIQLKVGHLIDVICLFEMIEYVSVVFLRRNAGERESDRGSNQETEILTNERRKRGEEFSLSVCGHDLSMRN
jgi:hypothetical protein